MTLIPATITAELLEHADGRPVAYIDATGVAVFACQQPDGTYVIDICTRDDTADGRLRLLLDGQPLPGTPGGDRECPASHTTEPGAAGDGSPGSRGGPPHAARLRHWPDPGLNHRPHGVAGQRASGPFHFPAAHPGLCHPGRLPPAIHR